MQQTRNRWRWPMVIGWAVALAAGPTIPAAGQAPAPDPEAQRILEAAQEQRRQSTDHVDNYTLVQSTNGVEVTLHYEKQMVDGEPVFVPTRISTAMGGVPGGGAQSLGGSAPDEGRMFRAVRERAQLLGVEAVDGEPAHKLEADGLAGLDLFAASTGGEEFTLRKLTLWIDDDEYVTRRMVLEGTMTIEGEPSPLVVDARLQDYRRVDGMYEPFRRTVTVSGLRQAMTGGDPEREEQMQQARERLQQMEQQLASMPEAQRQMLESRMKPMMDRLRQAVGSESGEMEMTTVVKELLVNPDHDTDRDAPR